MRIRSLSLATVLLSVVLLLSGCESSDYKKAGDAFAQGNFAEAQAIFEELGDYKDSAEKVLECKYGIADEKMAAKDFEGALKVFSELEDYKDSAEKTIECKYDIAKDELVSGKYESAIEDFEELGEYSDAKELLSDAKDKLIESRLPGTYETGKIDYTDIFLDGVDSYVDDSGFNPSDFLDGVELGINTMVTFTADGKIIQSVDEESFRADMETLKGTLSERILEYFAMLFEEELASQGLSLEAMYAILGVDNLEDLLASISGFNIADLLDESFEEAFNTIPMHDEGTYEIKDGQIIGTDSRGDTDIFLMDLDTGKLTVPGNDVPKEIAGMYPMEFTKVN